MCEKYNCDIHSYILMTNHMNLLMMSYRAVSIVKLYKFLVDITCNILIIYISVRGRFGGVIQSGFD